MRSFAKIGSNSFITFFPSYRQIRESFRTLQSGIDKLKKETAKEMENNERLTSVQSRLEEEIQMNGRINGAEKEKISNLESQFSKISKLVDQNNAEFNEIQAVSLM